MSVPAEKQDSRLMRAMFASIAPRYDFITRILSYGMDRRWKRLGVMQAVFPENATVLDLASGTGDFSKLVRERQPDARPIAVDITEPMLQLARAQGLRDAVCGDATSLPFPDSTFDSVFIGYGLRNFSNLKMALAEIARVTRPGGLMVSLDFFLPPNRVFRELTIRGPTVTLRIRCEVLFRLTSCLRCCAAPATRRSIPGNSSWAGSPCTGRPKNKKPRQSRQLRGATRSLQAIAVDRRAPGIREYAERNQFSSLNRVVARL